MVPARQRMDVLQGTLDLLILKAVSLGALHGYGILQRIEQLSGGKLQGPQGSLYPALYRVERQGWITGEWGASGNNRSAKFYRLTAAGRRQLKSEEQSWSRMTEAIGGLLRATVEER